MHILPKEGRFIAGVCHAREKLDCIAAANIRWNREDVPFPFQPGKFGELTPAYIAYRDKVRRYAARGLNTMCVTPYPKAFAQFGVDPASAEGLAVVEETLRWMAADLKAAGLRGYQITNELNVFHFRVPLTMEQVEAITAAAPHHKYGILPLLMLYTGLRRGEAVALRWKDIDFERGIITVSQAAVYIGNRTTQIGDTKTKAGHRKLPLLPILREQLGTPGAPDNYVLYNRTTPLPYTSIKRHWTQLQEDIPAMADATPHRLRHTYLLLLRRAGVDAATQQYLMGHADYDTTANIYTHIDETDVTTATAQLLNALPPR